MADTIDKTIYRLELDGSAYIEGVDKVSASTDKLSASQDAANKKLTELQKKQQSYKKQLEEITAVIQANEKETIDLTRQFNLLSEAEKKTSTEGLKLKAALKDIAFNTKEFRSEAAVLRTNLSQTTEQLKIQTAQVKAAEVATGGFSKGVTKAYSGLRTLANLIPGIGIGGLVALISGPVINAFQEWFSTINKTSAALKLLQLNQDNLNELTANANKDAGKQIADLEILYRAATDVNLSMKDRLSAVKDLQQEFPDYFANIKAETILNGSAEEQYKALALAIQATSRAKAAKEKLDVLEGQKLDKDFERQKVINATTRELSRAKEKTGTGSGVVGGLGVTGGLGTSVEDVKQTIRNRRDLRLATIDADKKTLQDQIDFIIDFVGLEDLSKGIIDDKKEKKEKEKKEKKVREIQNDFEKKKAELDARLAALNAKEADDESKIRIEFAARLSKEQLEITKNKNLTRPQKAILNSDLAVINKIELDKAISEFRKKVIDARKKIADELRVLQDKNTQDNINLLQDEFTRRAALLEFNEQKELLSAKENTQKRLSALDTQRLLIGEKAYQEARAIIITAGEEQVLNIIQRFANERKDLSADIFKGLLDAYDLAIRNADLIRNEDEAKALQASQAKFLSGKITFEQFQKDIAAIQKRYNKERLDNNLQTQINQLAALDRQIADTNDKTTKEYADLIELQKKYREKIAAGQKEQVKGAEDPSGKKQIDTITEYATALGKIADSVVAFWQKANEAEMKALDRSISLQQKRVDAAQRIAERGNAQYLKNEEDKLRDLEVKRENAARKQMGIDAALQASQILVGITGAISHIGTGTAVQTIAEIAVIIGALATGYGLVKSLQGNQPQLAEGTTYLQRGRNPKGKDTIPAWLNEGEAVTSAEKNKSYHPAIVAIHDGLIPADHLNNFVKNYHHVKRGPQVDYGRIKNAAELHIGSDGRMAVMISEQNKLIVENNSLQKQTLEAMKSMAVSASIDKNGVAIMVNEYIEQMKIDKRV